MNFEWSWNRFGIGIHYNPYRKMTTWWLGFMTIETRKMKRRNEIT